MKHILIVTWKKKRIREAYATLTAICDNKGMPKMETINTYLSRKKIPFENDDVLIEKFQIKRKTYKR